MYFDIERENGVAEYLAESATDIMFEIRGACEKIDVDFPTRNVEVLENALEDIGRLERLLSGLKKQLAYMRESELEFEQEINAEPSSMEIYKRGINA